MSKQDERKLFQNGLVAGMKQGTVAVPYLLLKYYPKLKLTDPEAMLLIHLMAFKEKEQKDFPTIEELQNRMTSSPDTVIHMLQKLMKQKMISIDEEVDPISGVQSEIYNLDHLYERIALCLVEEELSQPVKITERRIAAASEKQEKDIFTIFENEFARPLSPMECETISGWIDQDQYPIGLILAALKEAVFAGKIHFRYIDRILLEWSRNRVYTVEQAKEYAQKFRGAR